MMKKEFYDRLYIVEDDEFVPKHIKDSSLVWISKHWELFYSKKPSLCEAEILDNYTLLLCESDDEFKTIDTKIDSKNQKVFDYSFEFKYPSLLVETEYLEQCLS